MKRSFVLTLGGNALILILNIISGVITARALGPTGKGVLRTLIIWPTILSQIALLGMNEAYIFFKNKENYNIGGLKSTIFFGVLLTSTIFSLVVLFIFFTLFKNLIESQLVLLLIFAYIPIANIIQIGLSFLQEEMAFKKYNLIRIAFPLIYLSLLSLSYKTLTPERCFSFLFFSNLFLILFFIKLFLKLRPSLVSKKLLLKSMEFGIKTQLASLIGSFSQQVDQAILSLVSTPKILGVYSVAISVSRIGNLAPNAAQIVLYPRMSRHKTYLLKKNISLLFLFNFIIYAMLFLTLKKLILLFYGEPFVGATRISLILFGISFPFSVLNVGTAYFKSIGQPIKTTISQIIILLTLLILIPLFYAKIGLIGVAIASVIAYSNGAIYYIFNLRKNHEHGR